jgi:hypothetical protein
VYAGIPAARLGRGKYIAGALPRDLLDPAELVDYGVGEPAMPQVADGLGGWSPQCGTPFRSQLRPRAIQFGQAAGLNQQRPGDGGDAFVGVEITVHKVSVDGANGGGRGAVGLVTAPQLASRAQFEHRPHIGQRFTLGQPHLSLVGVARGIHCGHAVLAHCR